MLRETLDEPPNEHRDASGQKDVSESFREYLHDLYEYPDYAESGGRSRKGADQKTGDDRDDPEPGHDTDKELFFPCCSKEEENGEGYQEDASDEYPVFTRFELALFHDHSFRCRYALSAYHRQLSAEKYHKCNCATSTGDVVFWNAVKRMARSELFSRDKKISMCYSCSVISHCSAEDVHAET